MLFILTITAFFFLMELLFRIRGRRPWLPPNRNIKIDSARPLVTKHNRLGFTYLPGRVKVTLNSEFSFTATHLDNTLRITHPLDSYNTKSGKPEIWIFGCSLTYGWGINDEATFPWLLQERLPDYEIVNFGVGGYGTLQSLIQFKEAIKSKIPRVVVIAYASLHNARNVVLRKWLKRVVLWDSSLIMPYARIYRNDKIRYQMGKIKYRGFPLMRRSSFVHWVEERYNEFEEKFYRGHDVSKAILREFFSLCNDHGICLAVAGVTPHPLTRDMLKFCEGEGMRTTDISVNLGIPENNNLPFDSHPSPLAAQRIAKKLYDFLEKDCLSITTHNLTSDKTVASSNNDLSDCMYPLW